MIKAIINTVIFCAAMFYFLAEININVNGEKRFYSEHCSLKFRKIDKNSNKEDTDGTSL